MNETSINIQFVKDIMEIVDCDFIQIPNNYIVFKKSFAKTYLHIFTTIYIEKRYIKMPYTYQELIPFYKVCISLLDNGWTNEVAQKDRKIMEDVISNARN
jgi:hypothetical protein